MLIGLSKVNYGQQEKEFAEYGISGSLSPFGISLSMSYNKTNKTSFISNFSTKFTNSLYEVSEEIAESLDMKTARGALVSSATAGGPAEKAGVKTGDVIIKFNDIEIRNNFHNGHGP